MITKITNDNINFYRDLFIDANSYLNELKGTKDQDYVYNIETYFAHLEELADGNLKYTMLPIDEEKFIINADSRKIEVPENFKLNGLAVQGDDTAEIIWFEIDRYFDIMDFNNTIPCVQWRRQGEDEIHRSTAWYQNINTTDKYVFGWPIDKAITEYSGMIEFSVRFLGFENDVLNFSFNTLPVTLLVNESLSIKDINNTINQTINNAIKDRIKNSITSDISLPLPPQFVDKGKSGFIQIGEEDNITFERFLSLDNTSGDPITVHIGNNGTKKTLKCMAASTAEDIDYMQKKSLNNSSWTTTNETAILGISGREAIYLPVLSKDEGKKITINNVDKKLKCYTSDSDTAEMVNLNEVFSIDDSNLEFYLEENTPKYLKVWINKNDCGALTLDAPGYYRIVAKNDLSDLGNVNASTIAEHFYSTLSETIYVPNPEPINVTDYYLKTDLTTPINRFIISSTTPGEFIGAVQTNDTEHVDPTYVWTREGDNTIISSSESLIPSKIGSYKLQVINKYNSGTNEGGTSPEENLIITRESDLTYGISTENNQLNIALTLIDSEFTGNVVPNWLTPKLFGEKVQIKYYVSTRKILGFSQSDINDGTLFLEVNADVDLNIKNISSSNIAIKEGNKAVLNIPAQGLPTVDAIYKTLGIKITFNDGINGENSTYTYCILNDDEQASS